MRNVKRPELIYLESFRGVTPYDPITPLSMRGEDLADYCRRRVRFCLDFRKWIELHRQAEEEEAWEATLKSPPGQKVAPIPVPSPWLRARMADLREVEAWCAKQGHPVPQDSEEEDLRREVQEEVDALFPVEDWLPQEYQNHGEEEEEEQAQGGAPMVRAPSNPAFPPGFPFHNGNPFEQEGFPFHNVDPFSGKGKKKGKKQKKAETGGGERVSGNRNEVVSRPAPEGALVPVLQGLVLKRRRVRLFRKMAMSSLVPLAFLGMLTGQAVFFMSALVVVMLVSVSEEGDS